MNILLWLLLGLIAGWLASVIMGSNSQQGMLMDIILGVVGAFVGGFVMNLFGAPGVSGFNIYSIVVAVIGAVALIWLGRALRTTTS
jgi:uncharacterized membrane protein YeaQ/YmgE (transglycosylase-associated protein family)